jgi:hypothetical protein
LSGYHTYSVIINRTNYSAEYLQFLMDSQVVQTITEAQVGVTAWKEAMDHGFYIVLYVAMGGTYPNLECNCTSPTAQTASGEVMSIGDLAVYEKGGNSTPSSEASAAGDIIGPAGLCLTNQNSQDVQTNPITLQTCDSLPGQAWTVSSDGTLRVQGGCLDDVAGGTTSGSWVDWYPCNGSADQTWVHESNGEIVNPRTGLCLADPLGDTSSRIVIETCTNAAEQHWKLPLVVTLLDEAARLLHDGVK